MSFLPLKVSFVGLRPKQSIGTISEQNSSKPAIVEWWDNKNLVLPQNTMQFKCFRDKANSRKIEKEKKGEKYNWHVWNHPTLIGFTVHSDRKQR